MDLLNLETNVLRDVDLIKNGMDLSVSVRQILSRQLELADHVEKIFSPTQKEQLVFVQIQNSCLT